MGRRVDFRRLLYLPFIAKTITNSSIKAVLDEACRLGKTPKYSGATEANQEEHLVRLLHDAADGLGFKRKQIRHVGGHAFPDVVIDKIGVGIEIKCTQSHRTFNGNSVWGSTAHKGLNCIYLMYWIRNEMEFGYKNYFECVTDVVATHYPRFRLYLDATDKDCVFGPGAANVGTEKEIIFGADGIQSEKILQWMRKKAIASGSTPWWIPPNESALAGSSGLRWLSDMGKTSPKLKEELLKKCYLMFPEIIFSCENKSKYKAAFTWAIGRYGVLLLRDNFSAGGKQKIELTALGRSVASVPKVIVSAKRALENSASVSFEDLYDELGVKCKVRNWENFLTDYKEKIRKSSFLDADYTAWSRKAKNVKFSRKKFITAVLDYMLRNFEKAVLKSTNCD